MFPSVRVSWSMLSGSYPCFSFIVPLLHSSRRKVDVRGGMANSTSFTSKDTKLTKELPRTVFPRRTLKASRNPSQGQSEAAPLVEAFPLL